MLAGNDHRRNGEERRVPAGHEGRDGEARRIAPVAGRRTRWLDIQAITTGTSSAARANPSRPPVSTGFHSAISRRGSSAVRRKVHSPIPYGVIRVAAEAHSNGAMAPTCHRNRLRLPCQRSLDEAR